MKRVRKAWSGGKPPELNPVGKALVEHLERCAWCKEHTTVNPCSDGRRLYQDFNESLKRTASIARAHDKHQASNRSTDTQRSRTS